MVAILMHTFSSKQDDKKARYGQLPFWIYVFLILGRKALGGYFFPYKILIRFDSMETTVRFGPQMDATWQACGPFGGGTFLMPHK